MHSLIGTYLAIVIIAAAVAAYLLPTFIAWSRHAPGLIATAIINVTLGWTLIGWLAALAMAMRRPAPTIQVINQITTPSPQAIENPGQPPGPR